MSSPTNIDASSRKTANRAVMWFGVFTALIAALCELNLLQPILAGVPNYESLDVQAGTVAQVGRCGSGGRGSGSIPVWIASAADRRMVWLPCTREILALRNQIGTEIEVRSRRADKLFFKPVAEVWDVKAGGVDVYSYQARVERSKGPTNYVLAISCPIVFASFFGVFVWSLMRKGKNPSTQP